MKGKFILKILASVLIIGFSGTTVYYGYQYIKKRRAKKANPDGTTLADNLDLSKGKSVVTGTKIDVTKAGAGEGKGENTTIKAGSGKDVTGKG